MNPKNPNLPPQGACNEACFFAEGERCGYKCGGACHSLGALNQRESKEQRDSQEAEQQ